MAVPDYQSLMLPLLRFASRNKGEISTGDVIKFLAKDLKLSELDLRLKLPSGIQSTFVNRVGWASTYMKKALLLEPTSRGFFRITSRGRELLEKQPKVINVKILEQFPEFIEFQHLKGSRKSKKGNSLVEHIDSSTETPSEALETAYENLRDELADELLRTLKKITPTFFEQVVVDVLVKMGYGGSHADAGKATRISKDGGIDGIIKEDKLGLDAIYIQAKRWDNNSVGQPEVMQFVGALEAHRANKGIFITTSKFTNDAINYVSKVKSKIVLINGEELANLMIEYEVGVSTISLYPVKKIDSDYFE